MLRVSARPGLLSGKFRHGGLSLSEEQWSSVDANDEEIRATLLGYVGSHVRIAQGQDTELAAAGLGLDGGRLIDVRAAERAAKEAAAKAAPPPQEKKKEARAEK